MSVEAIWTVGGVLVGLQTGFFGWRIQREVGMKDHGEPAWLPPAEWLNLAALVVTVGGVFVLPILGVGRPEVLAREALGLSLVLLAGYPLALAGHYRLLTPGAAGGRTTFTGPQEQAVIAITALAAVAYLVATRF